MSAVASRVVDPARVLGQHAACGSDPTTHGGPGQWWRATHTPDGPGTLVIRWHPTGRHGEVDAEGFGRGGGWLLDRVPALLGHHDDPGAFDPLPAGVAGSPAAQVVAAATRRGPLVPFARSETPYHDLLPIILAQRITAGEAARQWWRLCHRLGEPAPGPLRQLRLPPHPDSLARRPAWWFHPLGIESKRASALAVAARHAHHLWHLDPNRPADAQRWLVQLPGIGAWTAAGVAQRSFGDPDAVITGDYWLPHLVVHALTGRPRGTDAEMLELLHPWAPHRARVVRLLGAAGHRVVRFAAGRRVLPVERW